MVRMQSQRISVEKVLESSFINENNTGAVLSSGFTRLHISPNQMCHANNITGFFFPYVRPAFARDFVRWWLTSDIADTMNT